MPILRLLLSAILLLSSLTIGQDTSSLEVNGTIKIVKSLKNNGATYSAQVADCLIHWSLSYEEKNQDRIYRLGENQKECLYPFHEQLPLHRKILRNLFNDWDIPRAHLSWGSLGNDHLKDWAWNIPVAMASSKSPKWQQWRTQYPHVSGSDNAIFVELANESDTFSELRLLFMEFDFDLRLKSVEKVFAKKANELPFYDQLILMGLKGNPRLLYDVGGSYFELKRIQTKK